MKKNLHLIILFLFLIGFENAKAGAKSWTGVTSTDWGTPSNWSGNKLPAAGDDVTVALKPYMPVLTTGAYTINSIVIQSGATLTQTGGSLTVVAGGSFVQIAGTLNQSGGSLFTDHNFSLLAGGIFNQSGVGLVHLAKNATTLPAAKISIAAGAVINQSGGTIYTKDYSGSKGVFNQTGSTALFKVGHDWKPGANSKFLSVSGTVEFTASAGGGANFSNGTRQFTNILVDAGVDPKFDNAINSTVPISGNFTNNNTNLNVSTSATFIFNGSAVQNIYSAATTANPTFGHLIVSNNGSTVLLTSNANVAGNITIKAGTFDLSSYTCNRVAGGGTLTVTGGTTMRLGGNAGGQTGSNFPLRETATLGKTSTVEYYGSGQTIYATPVYGNLTISATGTKTATAALTVAGNFTLSTATFVGGSFLHSIGGNWTMTSGIFTNTGNTINFNGTTDQNIASTGAFNKIIINKASGATNITTDVTAISSLTFTKGILTTANNKMIIPPGSIVIGASQATGWVNGNLQKYFASTAGGSFEVGCANFYSPATTSFVGSFTAGSLIAKAIGSAHPNITTSTIASKNISRYWSLSLPGSGALSFNKITTGFTWNVGDNYSPVVTASMQIARFAASTWSYYSAVAPIATNITSSGNIFSLGDFTVGEVTACSVSTGFTYGTSEVCTNTGTVTPLLNTGATAGTFSSTNGLSLNSSTGLITPATSTAGTYTITNTIAGACPSTSANTIKITAAPTASISYPGTTFCQSLGVANVSLTGSTGGTFSSTYGLVIDDATGQVDLTSSDPGTYTVTYTTNPGSACSAFSTTTTITVTTANYANISYEQDAYCLNGGTASVDFDGTTGGTFSASSSGLKINATTGDITLATSTPGTYTITYTGAAINGCVAFTGSTTITITSSSPGTISYSGNAFCPAGTASPTITGQTGGLFSSSAGLVIDEITGDVDLGTSVPGTYTIMYSFGGCYSTTTISIASPTTTISYTGSPFCALPGTASVTQLGLSGGTYSSTAGLSLNSTNGDINLGTSTPGPYTITYAVPASGTCPPYTITTDIVIVSPPSAAIGYSGNPFCNVPGTTVAAIVTGTSGGTFSSTNGLIIDNATGIVDLGASTPGTYTVTYTVPASSACSQFQTSTTITINLIGTWTGLVSTDWNTSGNWQCNFIPNSTTNVLIPSGLTNYPVINSLIGMTKNLTMQAGSSITITNGTLQIAGTTTVTGGFIGAANGKVEFDGNALQTVPANLFASNVVYDLLISNPAGVTLAGPVRVTNSVSFGNVNNSFLNSNGYLTLVSTSSTIATLTDVTNGGLNSGNTVSGDVTVERYILGKRAYRFLTAPVTSTTSFKTNWMEGVNNTRIGVNVNPVPNYGTHITGAGGSANNFDVTNTNNPSLFTFNLAAQSWSPAPNSNLLFSAGTGYRIMVRGNRTVDLTNNNASPSATTLRATGKLTIGTVKFTKPGGGGLPLLSSVTGAYSFIGNPYASSVDWTKFVSANVNDIAPTVYLFDPTVSGSYGRGAYVSYNGVLNVKSLMESLVGKDLQSGQAFFVQTSGPNPSITFNENLKSGTFIPIFRSATNLPHINVELLLPEQGNGKGAADGTGVYFSEEYSNAIGQDDSYKFTNQDENIAVVQDGTPLSIEGRKPVLGMDSIPLKVWQLAQKNYTLKINVVNFPDDIESYLEDRYLKTTIALSDGETRVPFSITSDPTSAVSDRFKIVFESLATLPVRITGMKAYEKNKGVQIDWVAESESNIESYEVEKSPNAINFVAIGSVKAKNNFALTSSYGQFDAEPFGGDNYYRIKTKYKSGEVIESEIVRVHVENPTGTISISPSLIVGNEINMVFKNKEPGNYTVTLLSSTGQRVYTTNISHLGGSSKYTVNTNISLGSGLYRLIVAQGEKGETIPVIVQ